MRALHIACGLAYLKAGGAKRIVVQEGIPIELLEFLDALLRLGMREFAFVNQARDFLALPIEGRIEEVRAGGPVLDPDRVLVPIGGGKDSIVTLESLVAAGFNVVCYSTNSFGPIKDTAAVRQLPLFEAIRRLDPKPGEANALGARNGHVPVTEINSTLACITALICGVGVVAMSNEKSADESSGFWGDLEVNHQWSKGSAFEELMHRIAFVATGGHLEYFSFLRGCSELVIARKFASLRDYHGVFLSCNRGFKMDASLRSTSWCGDCPKCRFVWVILSPFLERSELVSIFGHDLSTDPSQLPGFRALAGLNGMKPLECVGELAEVRLAMQLGCQKGDGCGSSVAAVVDEVGADLMPSRNVSQSLLSVARLPSHFPAKFREALNALE